MRAKKISITLDEERHLPYANLRKKAYGDSLSSYLQHLIEKEQSGEELPDPHNRKVLDAAKEVYKKGMKAGDNHPLVVLVGETGIVTSLCYIDGDPLWRQIADWTKAMQNYGLKHLWLVLPDSCDESDVVNFSVLARNGIIPELSVARLSDWKELAEG